MGIRYFILLFINIHFALVFQTANADDALRKKVEKAVLKNRRALKAGIVQIKVDSIINQKARKREKIKIWYDGKSYRHQCDDLVPYGIGRFVEDGKYHVSYYNPKKVTKKHVRYLSLEDGKSPPPNTLVLNPQILGMTASILGHFHAITLDDLIGRNDVTNATIKKTTFEEEPCYRIDFEYKTRPEDKFTIWIAYEKDYNIVKRQIRNGGDETFLEVKLRKYDNKYWYPKSTFLYESRNGKVTRDERVEVLSATFNPPNMKKHFQLTDFNIPKETPIIGPGVDCPLGTSGYWDGTKIDCRKNVQTKIAQGFTNPQRTYNTSMLIASVVLCIFSAVCFWYFFSYRPRIT